MHNTKQGETWDLISIVEYGNVNYMADLISANPKYSDVLIFDAGISLVVPVVEKTKAETLPPWKR